MLKARGLASGTIERQPDHESTNFMRVLTSLANSSIGEFTGG